MNPIFRCNKYTTPDRPHQLNEFFKTPTQTLFEILQEFPEFDWDDIIEISHSIFREECICEYMPEIIKVVSSLKPDLICPYKPDFSSGCPYNCDSYPGKLSLLVSSKIRGRADKPYPKYENDYNSCLTWETEYQPRMALQEFLYKQYSKTQRPLTEEKDKEMMETRLKAWVNAHAADIVKRTIQQHNFMGDNKYMTSIRLSGTSMTGFSFEMPYQQAQKSSREEICGLLRQKLLEKIKGLEKLEAEIKEAKLHIHSASEEVIYVCCGCEIRS